MKKLSINPEHIDRPMLRDARYETYLWKPLLRVVRQSNNGLQGLFCFVNYLTFTTLKHRIALSLYSSSC